MANFRNLWLGQTASMLGANTTAVMLPLIGAVTPPSKPPACRSRGDRR